MISEKYRKYLSVIKKFPNRKVLVVGDLMVDKFVYGSVSRISPEAPVPVVEVKKEMFLAGGAGNVANNIASLKGKAMLTAVIGNDITGRTITDNLKMLNINTDGVFIDDTRPTTIKTRVIAHHQQVVRVDKESKNVLSKEINQQISNYIEKVSKDVDAIIISDYGKGVVNKVLINKIISIANRNHLPVCVDPKVEHFAMYKKTTVITPNLQEATSGMRIILKSDTNEEIKNLGVKILNKLKCNSVVITLGERGMAVFE
ncbi:MAG: PfkB family carbohydrate kinase, partial [Elusimicrobiota bacterium]|nr:PfkB family carbohydrate kinase [Elusimicrobiota bacterium]